MLQDGKTALHYAAGNGHLPVTQWLIEKEGMDPLEMTSTVTLVVIIPNM